MDYSKFRKNKNHLQFTTNYFKHPVNTIRKIAITTIAATTLSFGAIQINPTYADSNENDSLSTVYYIYANNQCIGIVDNNYKQIIDNMIKQKKDPLEDTYKESELSTNLVFVPEMVFHPVSTNDVTVQNVKSKLEIKTKAYALLIDGKPVAYFENEAAAKDVIKQLKLKYVTAKQLNALKIKEKLKDDQLPPLKVGQSRILDVKLDKSVSVVSGEIQPNQILTVDQGVKLLQKGTLVEKQYTVKDGDVLGGIAAAHDLTLKELLALNPGLTENSLIGIGDKLNVTQYKPYVNVIVKEEVYQKENVPYDRKVVETDNLYKGDKKVKQHGHDGERLVNYVVAKENGNQVRKVVLNQEVIKSVVDKVVLEGTKVIPSRGTGNLAWPTIGGYISSDMGYRWGRFHKGIDIARPSSRAILAADNGVVVFAGWDSGGYGNKIIIDHNDGFKTLYGHLASISVHVGETVPKGTEIGIMGETGDATGIHLHFEVYKNGSLRNPLDYLR